MAQATQGAAAASNQLTFADMEKVAVQLGEEAGKGNDTRVKFQMKLVEAAFYNAVNLEPDKHGKDKDDATVLTEAYVKARSGASYFDTKAPNQRKEISVTRSMIKLGQWPNGGPGEPLQSMNNLITDWAKLRQKPENKGRLDDASNTLTKFSRVQTKRDSVLTQAELHDLCFKRPPSERTVEQRLEGVRKELMKIEKLDPSGHIKAAQNEITKRLKAIATEKGVTAKAKADAKANAKHQSAGKTGAAAHA